MALQGAAAWAMRPVSGGEPIVHLSVSFVSLAERHMDYVFAARFRDARRGVRHGIRRNAGRITGK
jgi:hypothetical protein